ncbi:MAG TPA: TldD/PmbA family protein, partial [Rhodospirillales bacterium]|nr:TldD/PmbA family protein [Rhodospirillales bacterium]
KLDELIARAQTAGADAADAVYVEGRSLSLSQRLGERENLERSEGTDLGLRVFVGNRQAIVSSSDISGDALDELASRAVAMARSVPEDPFCGLAGEDAVATEFPDLDIFDEIEPTPDQLSDMAGRAEDAARAIPGVTNSEGAEAGWGVTMVAIAASNGFAGSYSRSGVSLSVSVLAGEGTKMERDYDYATTAFLADLPEPEAIGRNAGERAVRRLNPKKMGSGSVPVVLDPRVSNGIVGHLASAINGASVARGMTFLKDKMGRALFPKNVTITDDPLRRRGLRSKPFDGEGVATKPLNLIDGGVLTTWIMDLRAARQLGLKTTGHASRGTSGPPSPSPTNLFMEPGEPNPADLMGDIKSGLYITEMIGFGINGVTGDYSRGAGGFWIENGELTYPVSEITVAGNLIDMFANITAANDLEFRYGTNAPTLRIEGMTIAGK